MEFTSVCRPACDVTTGDFPEVAYLRGAPRVAAKPRNRIRPSAVVALARFLPFFAPKPCTVTRSFFFRSVFFQPRLTKPPGLPISKLHWVTLPLSLSPSTYSHAQKK